MARSHAKTRRFLIRAVGVVLEVCSIQQVANPVLGFAVGSGSNEGPLADRSDAIRDDDLREAPAIPES